MINAIAEMRGKKCNIKITANQIEIHNKGVFFMFGWVYLMFYGFIS